MSDSVRVSGLTILMVLCLGAASTTQAGFDNGTNTIASFESSLAAGYYANPLTSNPNSTAFSTSASNGTSLTYSANGFSYVISDTSGIYYGGAVNPYLSTGTTGDTFTITFSGTPISAVGLDLFVVSGSGAPVANQGIALSVLASVTNQGVATTVSDPAVSSTGAGYFVDFTTSGTINSLTFSSTSGYYPGLTNLIVGRFSPAVSVPEPSSLALLGTGGLAVLLGYRRKLASDRRV